MRNKKGFTLAELMVVVAIIGVLVAVSVPIFNSQLEKSREATDLANVRSAYAQVMTEAMSKDGLPESVAVFLKQTQDGWQTKLPITIGGVTYNGTQSDNWKGNPKNKGMCRVSYEKDRGVIFNWEGGYAGDASESVEKYLIQIVKDKDKMNSTAAYYSNQKIRIGTKTVSVRAYYADSNEFKQYFENWKAHPCTYEQSPVYTIQNNPNGTDKADGFAYYTLEGEGKNIKVKSLVYVNSTNVYESTDEGRTWYDITPAPTETTTP